MMRIFTPPVTKPVTPPVGALLRLRGKAHEPGSVGISDRMRLKDRTHLGERDLEPVVFEKPTNRLQKRLLTEEDRAWMAQNAKEGSK